MSIWIFSNSIRCLFTVDLLSGLHVVGNFSLFRLFPRHHVKGHWKWMVTSVSNFLARTISETTHWKQALYSVCYISDCLSINNLRCILHLVEHLNLALSNPYLYNPVFIYGKQGRQIVTCMRYVMLEILKRGFYGLALLEKLPIGFYCKRLSTWQGCK